VEEKMDKKYKSLRFIGGLYKVLAFIVLIVVILGVLGMDIAMLAGGSYISDLVGQDLGGMQVVGAIFFTIFGLLGGALVFVSMYAVGELVSLLLSVEESTRYTALVLRDRPQ
jgi:hypothetical protein